MLRLIRRVDQLRHTGLHAKRHFVLADTSVDLRISHGLVPQSVDRINRVDDRPLPFCIHPFRVTDVQHRIAGRVKVHALKPARQKTAVPLPRGDRLILCATH